MTISCSADGNRSGQPSARTRTMSREARRSGHDNNCNDSCQRRLERQLQRQLHRHNSREADCRICRIAGLNGVGAVCRVLSPEVRGGAHGTTPFRGWWDLRDLRDLPWVSRFSCTPAVACQSRRVSLGGDHRATRFPATHTDAMRFTFEMLSSGLASSTMKSAHFPASSVPSSASIFMHRAASRVAEAIA